jgi:hypothetical protein
VPECFPADLLRRFGANGKTRTYSGVKEQIYLADFAPAPDYLAEVGLPTDRPLVVIRPPAPWTAYHRFENDLFDQLLQKLAKDSNAYLLFLPRLTSQAESVKALPVIHVAQRVYDGPNLLHHARLVVSGGGTMNREAAVLGTPVYTVFKGKLGAVDRYLIAQGRMMHLQTPTDLAHVEDAVSRPRLSPLPGGALVAQVIDQILEGAAKRSKPATGRLGSGEEVIQSLPNRNRGGES